jgi:DNA-binding LytR/AlgR family response regulator
MNCIIVEDDDASRNALIHLAKQVQNLTIVKACSDPVEAFDILANGDIQLMFLDVEMPGMNGLEMLKALDKKPHVILTTSHSKYAMDAYELDVIDYLVKPITLPRFIKAVNKVKEYWDSDNDFSMNKEYFFIKKNSVLTKVLIKDILWIEALGDYIKMHARDQEFVLHTTLKALEEKLPANKFIRIHRSYIVQIDSVRVVEDTTVYINDISIPIGTVYKEEFIKQLNLIQ